MYVIFALRLPLKRDKIHMVSQMALAKNLVEPFIAHLENLYNILCIGIYQSYHIGISLGNYKVWLAMVTGWWEALAHQSLQ